METRRSFLEKKLVDSFSLASKEIQDIALENRAIGTFEIELRVPRDWRFANNGGDYYRYLTLKEVSFGIFKAKEDWSAEWDISGYYHLEGYICLSKSEVDYLLSLPLDN